MISSADIIRISTLHKDDHTTGLPRNENSIIHSKISNFEYVYDKPTLSFKYVINGKECYVLDGHSYILDSGQFLLVNSGREYHTYSPRKDTIDEGMCVYLRMDMVEDVFKVFLHQEAYLLDNPFIKRMKTT